VSVLFWAATWTCAYGGFPVRSVDYTVDVDGPLAEVLVEQTFVNDADEPIEAVYVFPLHEEAAVDGMRIVIDGRVIEGAILEKHAAVEAYDDAIEEGHTAALTTQQRANVFTQQVGNIPPGAEVVVQLTVVQPVPHLDGAYELTLPLVVMPRFVAQEDVDAHHGAIDELVTGPEVAPVSTGMRADIDVVVDAGLPFTDFWSDTHDVGISEVADLGRAVTGSVAMDRDFVLQWTVSQERPQAALLVQDGHAILTLEPPESPPREHVVPRELIWVIDTSCSMGGRSMRVARKAMHRAIDHMGHKDSIRILRFSNRVWGDTKAHAVNPVRKARAHAQVSRMYAGGGTYLLDGVLTALDTPRGRKDRERYVIFLTDAGIGNETDVLAAIADNVGDAKLFAFGIGTTPNRWLLDEMARFGGGKTTWLRSEESTRDEVDRFIETIDKPVLSDIAIDWGDWEVESVWPRRLPTLFAGQPLLVSTRVLREGTTPVVVRGRLGDGVFEQVVEPRHMEPGRAIPSTWARQKIANLERDQVWGEVPELADDILETSIDYQVLSRYTAFLAVDRSRTVNAGGRPARVDQPVDAPAGSEIQWQHTAQLIHGGGVEEIVVEARQRAVSVEDTSRSTVLTKDFLNRVPAGRSYQNAVALSAGVSNPNLAGGPLQQTTYLLDGVAINDPVTGTYSLNLNVDAIQQVEVLLGGVLPERPGVTGPVVDILTDHGTNNTEIDARYGHTEGAGDADMVGVNQASFLASGPIRTDKAWALGSYGYDRTVVGDRTYEGHSGFAKSTIQPNPETRITVTGTADLAAVVDGEDRTPQGTGIGTARWQWFLSPEWNVDTRVSTQELQLAGDRRQRQTASTHLTMLSVDDPIGGQHDLKAGADMDRVGWTLSDAQLAPWLPTTLAEAAGLRAGVFAQDSYKPRNNVTINVGARLDGMASQARFGPRLHAAWDPFGDQRTKVAAGLGRYHGNVSLAVLAIAPELGPTAMDEWLGTVERELVRDLALGGHGTFRRRTGIASLDGTRQDRTTVAGELFLRKVSSRRWFTDLSYTHTRLLTEATGTLVDTGALEGFAHKGTATLGWDLPTDPWTLGVGLLGSMLADPLGSVAADPSLGGLGNVPRWSAGLSLAQTFDLPRGRLVLEAEGSWMTLLADGRELGVLQGWQSPAIELANAPGPRVLGNLRYHF